MCMTLACHALLVCLAYFLCLIHYYTDHTTPHTPQPQKKIKPLSFYRRRLRDSVPPPADCTSSATATSSMQRKLARQLWACLHDIYVIAPQPCQLQLAGEQVLQSINRLANAAAAAAAARSFWNSSTTRC